jgi:hypothetical protein
VPSDYASGPHCAGCPENFFEIPVTFVKTLPVAAVNTDCVALAVVFAAAGRGFGVAADILDHGTETVWQLDMVMNCRSSPCPKNRIRFTILSSNFGVMPLPQAPLQHVSMLAASELLPVLHPAIQ